MPEATDAEIMEALRATNEAIRRFSSTGKWTVFAVGENAKLKLNMEDSKVIGARTFMEQGRGSEVDASIRRTEIQLSQNEQIVPILHELLDGITDMQTHRSDFSKLGAVCRKLPAVAPAAVEFLNDVGLLRKSL